MTEPKALVFKRAAAEDFDRLYAILLENSAWLKESGIPQWDPPYPAHRFRKELADGQIVYFEHDDQLAGTVTISPDKPDYYPGDLWTGSAPAWYLSRLAVPTGLRGRGFGRRILGGDRSCCLGAPHRSPPARRRQGESVLGKLLSAARLSIDKRGCLPRDDGDLHGEATDFQHTVVSLGVAARQRRTA